VWLPSPALYPYCSRSENATAAGLTFEPYYFRTSDGDEIDLVVDFGAEKWAIKVKLTSSPRPADIARLQKAGDLIDVDRCFLVSRAPHDEEGPRVTSCGLSSLLDRLLERS